MLGEMGHKLFVSIILSPVLGLFAQPVQPPTTNAPLTINFQEALERARKYGTEIQTANITALLAREDRIQAKAAMLPQTQSFNQFIYTQPNGSPSGVFIANDGPHVYAIQAQAHQDLSLAKWAEYRRAMAAEAVAKAKADLAARGIVATVVQDYYAVVIAQRKVANAQKSLDDARKFLDLTQKQRSEEHTSELQSLTNLVC